MFGALLALGLSRALGALGLPLPRLLATEAGAALGLENGAPLRME